MFRKLLALIARWKKPNVPTEAEPALPVVATPDAKEEIKWKPGSKDRLPKECPADFRPYEWWEAWVRWLREDGKLLGYNNFKDGPRTYYAEHLFFGIASCTKMWHGERSVESHDFYYTDAEGRKRKRPMGETEYVRNVSDVREWRELSAVPLYLHEGLFKEHCYVMGPSGSGKTSLGIMPLLDQLIHGHMLPNGQRSPKRPVVIFDLKGDAALFYSIRSAALDREQRFLFFTPEKNAPTYRFNPFKGFDHNASSVAQLCQLILDALGLNHGKGYGRGYYTQRSRQALSAALKQFPNVSSFRELREDALRVSLDIRSRNDKRARVDAFELISVVETLEEYDQLVTLPDENDDEDPAVIYMPRVIRDCEIVYFWLPAALESISVGEIAKLALFNLRLAAQDWKRSHAPQQGSNESDERDIILVIDEFQHLAGENLRGVLQDARSFGIGAILANQGLHDLKTPTGFDLAPTVMANTRVKCFFTTPSEQECYVFVERGKGFTEALPFPKPGNPWLSDLSPEQFAYRTRLAWPVPKITYNRTSASPLPGWQNIPGGNSWVKKVQAKKAARKVKEALPQMPSRFVPKDDAETQKQKNKLKNLFPDEP